MDVGQFNQRRLFGYEEDIFLEHEEVTLDGLEVSFNAWEAVTTTKKIDHLFIQSDKWGYQTFESYQRQ
jgi:hypothetical protein